MSHWRSRTFRRKGSMLLGFDSGKKQLRRQTRSMVAKCEVYATLLTDFEMQLKSLSPASPVKDSANSSKSLLTCSLASDGHRQSHTLVSHRRGPAACSTLGTMPLTCRAPANREYLRIAMDDHLITRKSTDFGGSLMNSGYVGSQRCLWGSMSSSLFPYAAGLVQKLCSQSLT